MVIGVPPLPGAGASSDASLGASRPVAPDAATPRPQPLSRCLVHFHFLKLTLRRSSYLLPLTPSLLESPVSFQGWSIRLSLGEMLHQYLLAGSLLRPPQAYSPPAAYCFPSDRQPLRSPCQLKLLSPARAPNLPLPLKQHGYQQAGVPFAAHSVWEFALWFFHLHCCSLCGPRASISYSTSSFISCLVGLACRWAWFGQIWTLCRCHGLGSRYHMVATVKRVVSSGCVSVVCDLMG